VVEVRQQIDPAELIDATEVATILGLNRRTSVSVYRHRYDDFPPPAVERSRCVLWLRTDVEAWQAGRR
jgi:predicted DNA-binding transcriptional regulator AlpA